MTWLKKILKAILFCLLACLVFWKIQPLFLDQGEVLRWKDFQRVEKNTLNVIFLGSSHAYHSFNPEIIDDLIPIESFTVGIPGDNLPITFHEVQEILRYQQPDLIAIDTFTFHISQWKDGSYVYRFLNAGFDLHFLRYSADILLSNGYDWWNLFPTVRDSEQWKKDVFFVANPQSRTVPDFPHNEKGFAPLETIIRDQTYEEMPMEELLPQQPKNYLKSLEKIIQLSKKEKFDLLFFDTVWFGFANPVYDLYDPSAEYERIEQGGFPYLDFRTSAPGYEWQQVHLFDVDHPSTFGSLIMSVHMAEFLAKQYGLPIDEEKLAYYQTFFFKEHFIHQKRLQKTIELIPADESAPLYYSWSLNCQQQVMTEIKYSPTPSFDFKPCKTGESEVHVKIWNPTGDYILKAIFIVPAE